MVLPKSCHKTKWSRPKMSLQEPLVSNIRCSKVCLCKKPIEWPRPVWESLQACCHLPRPFVDRVASFNRKEGWEAHDLGLPQQGLIGGYTRYMDACPHKRCQSGRTLCRCCLWQASARRQDANGSDHLFWNSGPFGHLGHFGHLPRPMSPSAPSLGLALLGLFWNCHAKLSKISSSAPNSWAPLRKNMSHLLILCRIWLTNSGRLWQPAAMCLRSENALGSSSHSDQRPHGLPSQPLLFQAFLVPIVLPSFAGAFWKQGSHSVGAADVMSVPPYRNLEKLKPECKATHRIETCLCNITPVYWPCLTSRSVARLPHQHGLCSCATQIVLATPGSSQSGQAHLRCKFWGKQSSTKTTRVP